MKTFALISLLGAAASTLATTVSYDTGYDDATRSLTVVSCSDGSNGLMTKHPTWKTQGDIPHFPNIGGSDTIPGWNSDQCGQCYSVTYKGKLIYIQAIDHAASGLNISKKAMNQLTGNQAEQLGRVDATIAKVDVGKCGNRPVGRRSVEFMA